ncbi:hypothetical protein AUJ68_03560 [Candidatus Woesearchaeota archaeon CG1_02_57_44]|nr:MAG: hypothetical protein AUJ68_03560 [Candidatus Woesearchaeota archaeon CG1_02_57_44]
MKPRKRSLSSERLGASFIERLGALLENREVQQYVIEANDKYWYWEEVQHRQAPENLKPHEAWMLIKTGRALSATHLNPLNDPQGGFALNVSASRWIQEKLHEIDLNVGGSLQSDGIIPKQEQTQLLLSSLMEEAIASSQLEGAATTRKVAKEMLRTKRKPRNKNEQMIANNYETIQLIQEWVKEEMTPEKIVTIQKTITRGTLDHDGWAGRYRDNDEVRVVDVMTGEIAHIPPSYKEVPAYMENLCAFANKTSHETYVHPVIKACILHFLIGYIHPFEDGNGRTARALFYWYMLKEHYLLMRYVSISRIFKNAPARYAKAYRYTEEDDNDLTYFVKYHLEAIVKGMTALKEHIEKKQKEKQKLVAIRKWGNLNPRQIHIVSEFYQDASRIMTIKEAQEIFAVVYQTARTDLLGLMREGFLMSKTEGKRMVFFRSKEFENKMEQILNNKNL